MSRRLDTIHAGYFDDLYNSDPDPWQFRTSDYEHEKYRATLDALSRPRYAEALEVGCAIGILTRQLAERCDHLLALDGSAVALAAAQSECVGRANVSFACGMVPADFPAGGRDLIVLSEVLYYFGPDDLRRMAAWTTEALEPGGVALLTHWLGETPDYPLTGDEAVEAFLSAAPGLTTDLRRRRERYRLNRLSRPA